jgi:hypothetical protein
VLSGWQKSRWPKLTRASNQHDSMKWKFDVHSVLRRASRLSRWISLVIILLIAGRIALPYALKAYVNHALNQAHGGTYEGYFKVFFKDLDVFAWEKERKKNILEVFWHAIVGGVATVLKNHPQDQLATKVPVSGSYTNSSVGIWTAAATLLQNAFIHALVPKLDEHVTVEQVEKAENTK